jgi:hypothetical protein
MAKKLKSEKHLRRSSVHKKPLPRTLSISLPQGVDEKRVLEGRGPVVKLGDIRGGFIEVNARYDAEKMREGAKRLMEVMSGQALREGIDLEEIEKRQKRHRDIDFTSVLQAPEDEAGTEIAHPSLYGDIGSPVDDWELEAISSYYRE